MASFQALQDRLANSAGDLVGNFIGGLADFVLVLIFLGVGYIVAKVLSSIVRRGLTEM